MEVSEDYFNKCIHRFNFFNLRTLVSTQDVLACLPTGYGKSIGYQCWPSLSVRRLLAKEGKRQWEDDAIVLVISLQDLRLMVSHITFVVVSGW